MEIISHAPRERVSWNQIYSIWRIYDPLSRSTWACELKLYTIFSFWILNGSRSTWACELKLQTWPPHMTGWQSRSTWACELKFIVTSSATICDLSRSTWACGSIFVSTQDLSILNNTSNRLTKVGRYFYTQILYIFHVFSVKSANSHPEICANKWFII